MLGTQKSRRSGSVQVNAIMPIETPPDQILNYLLRKVNLAFSAKYFISCFPLAISLQISSFTSDFQRRLPVFGSVH